jgi:hypothetical protein
LCPRGSNRTLLRGPSTSPLDGMSRSSANALLLDTARRYWRRFIFMWVWPGFFLLSSLCLIRFGRGLGPQAVSTYGTLIGGISLIIAISVASAPFRMRAIPFSHAVFWMMFIPLVIWGVLCVLFLLAYGIYLSASSAV